MPTSSDTPGSNPTRELAAIMFSDVVGYTAIMGRDEHAALRALQESAQLLANPDGTRQVVLYGFTTRPRFRLSSFAAAQSK